jgi:hypothetical protein
VTSAPSSPQHSLATIVRYARNDRLKIGTKVIQRALEALPGKRECEVRPFIHKVCATLTESDFVERASMEYAEADVYAVRFDERSWYVKVFVDGDVIIVSCHRPDRPMQTVSGKVIEP